MKRKHIGFLLGTFLLLLTAMLISPQSASAAAKKTWPGIDENDWVVAPEPASNLTGLTWITFDSFRMESGAESVKISKLKSSNKKVAAVSLGTEKDSIWIEYGMKTGTSKITFKMNGKQYQHTFKVKYTCPFKTFKVGGKSYLKTFKKKHYYTTKKTLKNKALKVVCKKDWVITHVETVSKGKYKTKDYANGKKSYSAKYSAPQMMDGVTLRVQNTKTGFTEEVSFSKAYDDKYAVAE